MGAFYPMFERLSLPRWLRRPEPATTESTSVLRSEATDQIKGSAPFHENAENDIASQLARIWEKLLGVEFVRIDENYFDLGGDSSLTIQLFVQIEKQFGVRLPIVTLFEAPTVGELANAIRQARLGACSAITSSNNCTQ